MDWFRDPGSRLFSEDLEAQITILEQNARFECDTNDKWQYRRGYLDGLAYVSQYAAQVERLLEYIEESPDVEDLRF